MPQEKGRVPGPHDLIQHRVISRLHIFVRKLVFSLSTPLRWDFYCSQPKSFLTGVDFLKYGITFTKAITSYLPHFFKLPGFPGIGGGKP